jgi:hypothetical protein
VLRHRFDPAKQYTYGGLLLISLLVEQMEDEDSGAGVVRDKARRRSIASRAEAQLGILFRLPEKCQAMRRSYRWCNPPT